MGGVRKSDKDTGQYKKGQKVDNITQFIISAKNQHAIRRTIIMSLQSGKHRSKIQVASRQAGTQRSTQRSRVSQSGSNSLPWKL